MPRYSPAALLLLFFAITFPLWSNAYLSPPDSASYLAVARTAVMDGSLDFRDDYEALEFEWYFYYLTDEERISNDWPVGSGVVWLPVYAVAHGVAHLADAAGLQGHSSRPRTRLDRCFSRALSVWAVTNPVSPPRARVRSTACSSPC